jgi:hypothetical protein
MSAIYGMLLNAPQKLSSLTPVVFPMLELSKEALHMFPSLIRIDLSPSFSIIQQAVIIILTYIKFARSWQVSPLSRSFEQSRRASSNKPPAKIEVLIESYYSVISWISRCLLSASKWSTSWWLLTRTNQGKWGRVGLAAIISDSVH